MYFVYGQRTISTKKGFFGEPATCPVCAGACEMDKILYYEGQCCRTGYLHRNKYH